MSCVSVQKGRGDMLWSRGMLQRLVSGCSWLSGLSLAGEMYIVNTYGKRELCR